MFPIFVNCPLIFWRGNCLPKILSDPAALEMASGMPDSLQLQGRSIARQNMAAKAGGCCWINPFQRCKTLLVRWGVRTLAYRNRMAPEATALDRSAKRTQAPPCPQGETIIHKHIKHHDEPCVLKLSMGGPQAQLSMPPAGRPNHSNCVLTGNLVNHDVSWVWLNMITWTLESWSVPWKHDTLNSQTPVHHPLSLFFWIFCCISGSNKYW